MVPRNEKKLNNRFPDIAIAVADLDADECVVDGEVVARNGLLPTLAAALG